MKEEEFVAYIGIDWSDKKHDLWIEDEKNKAGKHQIIKPSPNILTHQSVSQLKRECQSFNKVKIESKFRNLKKFC